MRSQPGNVFFKCLLNSWAFYCIKGTFNWSTNSRFMNQKFFCSCKEKNDFWLTNSVNSCKKEILIVTQCRHKKMWNKNLFKKYHGERNNPIILNKQDRYTEASIMFYFGKKTFCFCKWMHQLLFIEFLVMSTLLKWEVLFRALFKEASDRFPLFFLAAWLSQVLTFLCQCFLRWTLGMVLLCLTMGDYRGFNY